MNTSPYDRFFMLQKILISQALQGECLQLFLPRIKVLNTGPYVI